MLQIIVYSPLSGAINKPASTSHVETSTQVFLNSILVILDHVDVITGIQILPPDFLSKPNGHM
jgi:hypothetical protein